MSLLVNKIGIGTVQFGLDYGISNKNGKTSNSEVSEILSFSKKNGIIYLDTAHSYGDAELLLGKNKINQFRIVSKYISNLEYCLEEQFKISLKRLNQSSVYAYLAHRPLDLIENNNENWNILQQYRKNNKITKVGASFNTVSEIEKIIDSGLELDIIQVPYNFLDSRFEKYMIELHQKGCEIHTRSTFLQGLFFCDVNSLDPFFDDVKSILREIQQISNLPTHLLHYVLEKNFIDVVNIGVNTKDQLVDNIKLLGKLEKQLSRPKNLIKNEILMPSSWPKRNTDE